MKILLIGDPHFKKNNLIEMNRMTSEILDLIKLKSVDLIICLGDTLDNHDRCYIRAMSEAKLFLIELSKYAPLIILIGNHDRENNSDFQSEYHPFVGFDLIPNITVVNKAIWDKERNFIYVPYVFTGLFKKALLTVGYDPKNAENKHPSYIFAHQEFKNCSMDHDIISTKGDVWLKKYPTIYSGHIHKYQHLNNIIYVGTFYQEDYGEDEDKAIMILDTTTNTYERYYLKSRPILKTFKLTYKNEKFAEELDEISKIKKDNIKLRLIITIEYDKLPNIKTLIKKYQKTFDRVEYRVNKKEENIKIKTGNDPTEIHNLILNKLSYDPNLVYIYKNEIISNNKI